MHAMPVVSDERPFAALRVVVLVLREPIVDDEQRARRDALRKRRDERFGGRIHLARIIAFARKAGFGGCAHPRIVERTFGPCERPIVPCDAALEPLAALS